MRRSNWWRAAAVAVMVLVLPLSAIAQGKHAAAAPVMLYEMSENAVLLNAAGNVLVPDPTGQSPTGLIDSTTGAVGVPARRYATSQLQGTAALGTPLCPLALLVTKPRTQECVVTATGNDDVALAFDSAGNVVATSGAVWGTYAIVVQLDNPVDSPELPVQTGSFSGVINFVPGAPLGFVRDGTFMVTGTPLSLTFDATFRMPFARVQNGKHIRPGRNEPAFYLLDDGRLQRVRQEESALGWPTVRFEITF